MATKTWMAQFGPAVGSGDLIAAKGSAAEWFQLPAGGAASVTLLDGTIVALTGIAPFAVYAQRVKGITAAGGALVGNGPAPVAPASLASPPAQYLAGFALPTVLAPGAVPFPIGQIGDVVATVQDMTALADGTADFEAVISIAGQIQQIGNVVVAPGGPVAVLVRRP